MKYRKMGKLDWEISALSFGGMRFPTKESWSDIDFEKAGEMVRYAIDQGVNYLDTAWMYHGGASEDFFGKLLDKGCREKVKIATKSPVWLIEGKKDFFGYFDKQRDKLEMDTIDFYLFHALNEDRWRKVLKLGLVDEMMKLKSQGKIDNIGFSFHGAAKVFREIIDSFDWDMTQIQYNYLDTNFQATVQGLDYAYKKNIGVVIMEPLRGGKLAESTQEIEDIVSNAPGTRTLVEWAIHFILNHPGVSTVLSGMSTKEQVEQNIAYTNAFDHSLSQSELQTIEQLKKVYERKIKAPCTSCMYCIPCPEGVHIPENLFLLNQAFWAGKAEGWIKKWYGEMESDDPTTAWHAKGAASRCTSCGECLEKCPQSISIPDELEIARKIFEDGLPVEGVSN